MQTDAPRHSRRVYVRLMLLLLRHCNAVFSDCFVVADLLNLPHVHDSIKALQRNCARVRVRARARGVCACVACVWCVVCSVRYMVKHACARESMHAHTHARARGRNDIDGAPITHRIQVRTV